MQKLVAAVKAHARAHYYEDGWDYIVECFDDAELQELLFQHSPIPTTPEDAIQAVRQVTKLWDDRRREIEAELF